VAAAVRERIGAPLSSEETASDGEMIATARTGLGETAFIAAWQAGQRLSLEQAVQEGLEQCAASPTSAACGSLSPAA
jgi:hypothetical protein